MKIYLCSRYSRRQELVGVREELLRRGHTVTSRWLDTAWEEKDGTGSSAAPAEYREEFAINDMVDVMKADCLIAFTEGERSGSRGGRHVEFGIALARGLHLIIVGTPENLFHHHPRVKQFDTVESAMKSLERNP
jgi:hypothetical protein